MSDIIIADLVLSYLGRDVVTFKGDLPGHEFRGNQYSEGGGGGGGGESSGGDSGGSSGSNDSGESIENRVNQRMRTRAADEAEKHGYKLGQRVRLDEESHGVLTATSSGLMAGIEDTTGKIAGYMHPSWGEINRWNK